MSKLTAELMELGDDKYYGTKIELSLGAPITVWTQLNGKPSGRQLEAWGVDTEEEGFRLYEPSEHYEEQDSYNMAVFIVNAINNADIEVK